MSILREFIFNEPPDTRVHRMSLRLTGFLALERLEIRQIAKYVFAAQHIHEDDVPNSLRRLLIGFRDCDKDVVDNQLNFIVKMIHLEELELVHPCIVFMTALLLPSLQVKKLTLACCHFDSCNIVLRAARDCALRHLIFKCDKLDHMPHPEFIEPFLQRNSNVHVTVWMPTR